MFKYLVVLTLLVWGVLLLQGKNLPFPLGGNNNAGDYSGAPSGGSASPSYSDYASGSSGGQGGSALDGLRQNAQEWIMNARDSIQDSVHELAQKIRDTMHR